MKMIGVGIQWLEVTLITLLVFAIELAGIGSRQQ